MLTENPAQGKMSDPGQRSSAAESAEPGLDPDQKAALARTIGTGKTEALVAAEGAKTLKDAINRVVLLYSYARKGDVHEFIETYIWRPVANMVQIFGTPNLKIEAVEEWDTKWVRTGGGAQFPKILRRAARLGMIVPGTQAATTNKLADQGVEVPSEGFWTQKTQLVKKRYKKTIYKVTDGKEGFHSRAFGDHDDLFGLVTPNVKKVLGLERKSQKILGTLDTRKEKRAAVRAYVAALERSHGVRG